MKKCVTVNSYIALARVVFLSEIWQVIIGYASSVCSSYFETIMQTNGKPHFARVCNLPLLHSSQTTRQEAASVEGTGKKVRKNTTTVWFSCTKLTETN